MAENQFFPQPQIIQQLKDADDEEDTSSTLNKTINIEELESRIRELECRLFPMEQLTWDSSYLLNTSGGMKNSSSQQQQHHHDNIWEEFDQEYYAGNKFKNHRRKKPSLLEKLKDIEENFESLETPLVKEFLDHVQDLNIYEYESFIEEAKDLQEFANFTSNDYESQEELPSSLLKKESLLNYINQQQEMIEHMSKSFEELEKLLPVVDMISDREQLDLLCNKLEDLKQFHLSMEEKHDLSTQQAETILKQLSAYNSMVSFNNYFFN